jgi:DNA-binding NarL/FixJ family response regulator
MIVARGIRVTFRRASNGALRHRELAFARGPVVPELKAALCILIAVGIGKCPIEISRLTAKAEDPLSNFSDRLNVFASTVLHGSLYCDAGYHVIYLSGGTAALSSTEALNKSSDKRKTVLIADDDEMVRTIIRQTLERDTDFRVCGEAVDGTDAVSKAKELSPDLIILDVRMPGLNGIEVAGILRHAQPKIRIVLVTMYAEDVAENFVSLFHIDAVLAKTDCLSGMTAVVTNLLSEEPSDIAAPSEVDAHLAKQQKPKQNSLARPLFFSGPSIVLIKTTV